MERKQHTSSGFPKSTHQKTHKKLWSWVRGHDKWFSISSQALYVLPVACTHWVAARYKTKLVRTTHRSQHRKWSPARKCLMYCGIVLLGSTSFFEQWWKSACFPWVVVHPESAQNGVLCSNHIRRTVSSCKSRAWPRSSTGRIGVSTFVPSPLVLSSLGPQRMLLYFSSAFDKGIVYITFKVPCIKLDGWAR